MTFLLGKIILKIISELLLVESLHNSDRDSGQESWVSIINYNFCLEKKQMGELYSLIIFEEFWLQF